MKQKNYEKKSFIIVLIIVLWFVELCFFYYLSNCKIIKYKTFQVIMTSNNEGVIYIQKENKSLWYKNSYFYYKDKKYLFEILDVEKQNNITVLKIKTSIKKLKTNDIITISIEEKRNNELKTIFNIWGGDKNNKG